MICHKNFKAITNSHLKRHGTTPKKYEKVFGVKTVPSDWVIGIKNPFFGKHHEEGKSLVKSKEYILAAKYRRLGKTCNEYLVNTTEETHKINLSKSHKGSKNPMWFNGISKKKYPHFFDTSLKRLIRDRENRMCFICGKSEKDLNRRLDIHHIDYDKLNCKFNNLIAVCTSCHLTTNFGSRQYWTYFLTILINSKYGNQQPSLSNVSNNVDRKVQRLIDEDLQPISLTRVPNILNLG